MTKYSHSRGVYKSPFETFGNTIIRFAAILFFWLVLIWLRFLFGFETAVLFSLSAILINLWEMQRK
jgi:hypothetical protein